MQRKTVLITGANGFIGGHVCNYLKEKGYYVIGLDRNEEKIKNMDEYIYCYLGTEDVNKLPEVLKGKKIDALVHLASDMRHEPYVKEVLHSNCVGTQQLLEFCEENQVGVFVQLSSLPVIGKPIQHPVTEEHPLKPPTVYHCTKCTQELLANYAYYTFGLRTVSFRITAPMGIGVNPKTIFPVFVNKAMNGEDLTLVGKGTRKQNYIHVRDIAQAIDRAINSDAQGVYNLASHNLLSNYELAQKCVEVAQSDSKIVFLDKEDPMDDYVWDICLDKIKKDMGYEPLVSVEEAIAEFIEYHKNK